MDSAEFLDLLGNENRRRILQLLARKPCYVTEISEFLGVSPKAVIDHLRKLEEAGLVNSRTDDRRRKYFSINRHVRLEVTVSPYEFGTKSAYPASTRLDLATCRRLSIDIDESVPTPGELSKDGDGETASVETSETGDASEKEVTANNSQRHRPPDQAGAKEADLEAGSAGAASRQGLLNGSTNSIVELATQLHDLQQLERELSLAQRWTQGRMTELRDSLGEVIGNGDPRLISELLVALADDAKEVEELSREVDAPVSIVEEVLEELTIDGVVYREGHEWHLDS